MALPPLTARRSPAGKVRRCDLDGNLAVQAFEKIEQLVRREAAEMPIHKMRDIGLRNPENAGNFALFQLLVLQDLEDVKADLRAGQKLVGVLQPEISKDVPGAFLELNSFLLFRADAPAPVLPGIVARLGQ